MGIKNEDMMKELAGIDGIFTLTADIIQLDGYFGLADIKRIAACMEAHQGESIPAVKALFGID